MDGHATSAAAFVEGGIQDACDDSCSICLEAFCDSDPSTVTGCRHEFHLQCILEWCQRSSQCPMCWQPISLKDPTSQELLEAVEKERNSRVNRPRSATSLPQPMLGDFEVQHLPVGAEDADLEERIIQHLAAAAAMGRTYRIHRREGNRGRPADHGRTQHMVYSRRQSAPPAVSSSPLSANRGEDENSSGQPTPGSQDRAGPSDFQSFSDSFKSRLNAVSMRYKESITKSTRGWKEKLFSRNSAISDLGSEVKREINAGIATVSRMMERLETRDGTGPSMNSGLSNIQDPLATETTRERITLSSGPTTALLSDSTSSASGPK
ncbi:E3 ubiquitin-protein ligase RHF2A-like isoform X2 [Ananas comosus]|uniref:RING-type E3 ubiquitin transferase n=1 Tax=Ananas comosus TaxID=4615 RepID=A0A6P5EAZ4_ANACO|nr:E3 ubiquitin-protein ligase RHF2A-like isoform X2 [Ananas comosus]XP_020086685.1 E3 ubiquitin-protein ligase RHF2A-like isoform X2 [Ananas comosus]